MADNSSDLLTRAQDLQRQKLLERAQSIQYEKLKPEPMSSADAAKVGLEQGATLGLRPVIAGLGAGAGSLVGQITDGRGINLSDAADAFAEGRKEANTEQNQARLDHPYITGAADIGGSLLTAPFLPIGKGVQGAMRVGAGLGAAKAASSAESLPEAVENVGAGVAGGAAGYGVAKTVGGWASNALSSLAENKAFKAAGAMLKDFRAQFNKDPEKINELGRTMLDEGLVGAGDSVKTIAQKSEALRLDTGKKIGQVYDKVLDTLTSHETGLPPETIMEIQSAGFHPEAQADEMKQIITNTFSGQPGSTGAINKAHQVIDELAMNGNNITPDKALNLKGGIDSMINWSKKSADLPLDQDALKVVRNYIQDHLNNQVSAMDQVLNSSLSKELVRLNGLYGNISQIANIAKDRVLRESANQTFGLGDKIMGGVGGLAGMGAAVASGHEMFVPAIAGAAAIGNMGARKYGNALLAGGADALARGVSNPNVYAPAAIEAMGKEPPKMSNTIRSRSDLMNRLSQSSVK